jgi:hypothetical protein
MSTRGRISCPEWEKERWEMEGRPLGHRIGTVVAFPSLESVIPAGSDSAASASLGTSHDHLESKETGHEND